MTKETRGCTNPHQTKCAKCGQKTLVWHKTTYLYKKHDPVRYYCSEKCYNKG